MRLDFCFIDVKQMVSRENQLVWVRKTRKILQQTYKILYIIEEGNFFLFKQFSKGIAVPKNSFWAWEAKKLAGKFELSH